MRLVSTDIPGVMIVETQRAVDERGYFARTFDEQVFEERGLTSRFPQHSVAHNAVAGTIRGLHFQLAPHAEAKVVRCVRGALFDVAVDLRRGSATYGRWTGVRLDDRDLRALYIPAGCAHGYQTLEDDTLALYLISEPYAPELARGINYADAELKIAWPLPVSCVSDRDRGWPNLTGVAL